MLVLRKRVVLTKRVAVRYYLGRMSKAAVKGSAKIEPLFWRMGLVH